MGKALLAITIMFGGALLTADLVQAQERTGEQIVKQKCIACHGAEAAKKSGAPAIDDRAAWAPRMKRGLDATVASAIKGHGAMPARGGMADLTDRELRAAIVYMFNTASAKPQAGATPPAPRDFNKQVVGDTEIFLGVSPAKSQGSSHITVRLLDARTQAPINDAKVEARVATSMGGSTKTLRPEKVGEAVTYGNDFRMVGNETHVVTVTVTRPKAAKVQTKFEVKH
jgi:cytochrome c5